MKIQVQNCRTWDSLPLMKMDIKKSPALPACISAIPQISTPLSPQIQENSHIVAILTYFSSSKDQGPFYLSSKQVFYRRQIFYSESRPLFCTLPLFSELPEMHKKKKKEKKRLSVWLHSVEKLRHIS